MKHILNKYDHSGGMHLKFCEIVITCKQVVLRMCNGLAVFWPTMDVAEI